MEKKNWFATQKKKKAIFFLFDSLFAIIVLITGTILVFSTYVSTPNTILTHSFAVELLNQLHDVEVRDLGTVYFLSLKARGAVPDDILDKSLLQLIHYYIEENEEENVFPLINETIGVALPENLNLRISVGDTEYFNVTNNLVAEEDARFLVVERRIFLSEYNGILYGPNVTKVKIW